MKRQHERIAFICEHKSHGDAPIRVFVGKADPAPKCPDQHTMKRQENRPYTPPPVEASES